MVLARSLLLFLSAFGGLTHSGPIADQDLPGDRHDLAINDDTSSIPSVHESAVLARRMLRLGRFATLSTVFQDNKHSAATESSAKFKDTSDTPIGLVDYYADCVKKGPDTGNPVIMSFDVGTTFRNVAAGSNISLSLDWATILATMPDPRPPPHGYPVSPAAFPRMSIQGRLEHFNDSDSSSPGWYIPACYLAKHPDALTWLPGNKIHNTHWARLVVEQVYWVGGFGNVAYIGWIDGDEWRSVTENEIEWARLPREPKGPKPSDPPTEESPRKMACFIRFGSQVKACINRDAEACPVPTAMLDIAGLVGWFMGIIACINRLARRLGLRRPIKPLKHRACGRPCTAAGSQEPSPLLPIKE